MIKHWWGRKLPIMNIFQHKQKIDSTQLAKQTANKDQIFYAIDTNLPQPFDVGKGNVLHLEGWCYHPDQCIKKLKFLVDGISHEAANHSLPRPEIMQALAEKKDCIENSLNSGFYVDIPFSAVKEKREANLTLKAVLENERVYTAEIGKLALTPSFSDSQKAKCQSCSEEDPLIAICMTIYNPRLDWLERQIDSIIKQSYRNWICIINDDCSDLEIYNETKQIASKDSRFCIYRNRTNLGFYHNFERCLKLVPEEAEFIALCDQDDYWFPDKLEAALIVFEPNTMLVYSDMKIVMENEETISETYWTTRNNNYKNLGVLLFTNTITGAASVFRASLLPILLPFPQYMPDAYHDHWIGCVALTVGKINYVDRPLYAYRQHGDNVIGHFLSKQHRLLNLLWRALYWILMPAATKLDLNNQWWHKSKRYFKYLILITFRARILKMRIDKPIKKNKRIIDRYTRFDRSATALLFESLRLLPLMKTTLGYPWKCFQELLAQRLLCNFGRRNKEEIVARSLRGQQDKHLLQGASRIFIPKYPREWRESLGILSYIPGKIAPLLLNVLSEAKLRINLIFSEINFKYFFGGYNAVFNLALKIDTLGYNVRIILVDKCDFNLVKWRRKIGGYKGLEDFFDRIEVIYRYDRSMQVGVNPCDCFIATSWWTAHIAHRATKKLGHEKFIYLTQEFEPIFYPGGTYYAIAQQSYTFPHYALYSTEFLKEFAKQNRIGVFTDSPLEGEKHSTSFQNAVFVHPPSMRELSQRKRRKLLFYARPEQHARRNAFELGILALQEAIGEGHFDHGLWEFHGIGGVHLSPDIPLERGAFLKMLPRLSLKDFYEFVTSYDIGLSLMMSPHPSLMPLDLAAAGVLTVTNTYANKTEDKLKAISGNIIPVSPTITGIKSGLVDAINRVGNAEERIADTRINWAANWDEAYKDEVLQKLKSWLEAICSSSEKQ